MPGSDTKGARFVGGKDGYLEWDCSDVADCVTELLNRVQDASDTVEDLRVERPTLEQRFLELVEGAEN
jgi:ABC-2 type transport system ATP-binding protein